MSPKPDHQPARWKSAIKLLLLAAVVLAPMWHLHVINRAMPPAKADLVPVWVGARAALHGQNAYSDATTRQIQISYYGRPLRPGDHVNIMAFAYPAHTLVLFSVLAPFAWPTVRIVCLILLPLLTAVSVPLWIGVLNLRLSPRTFALALILALASWPSIWGIHQIQPTLIVAALAAAGCFLLARGNPAAAGIIFSLATIKPQLIGPLLAWLCLWTLLRRQWRFVVSLTLSLAVLLATATWLSPGWVHDWRVAMAQYVVYRHLQPDLEFLFGHWAGLLLEVLIASATAVTLWRSRRSSPDSPQFGLACALALAATVCLLPNEMSMIYNHMLLLPACLAIIFRVPSSGLASSFRRIVFVQLQLDFVAVVVAVAGEILTGPRNFWDTLPFMDFLLPMLLTCALAIEHFRSFAPVKLSPLAAAAETVAF